MYFNRIGIKKSNRESRKNGTKNRILIRICIRFQGKEEAFQTEKQQRPEQGKIQKSTDFAADRLGSGDVSPAQCRRAACPTSAEVGTPFENRLRFSIKWSLDRGLGQRPNCLFSKCAVVQLLCFTQSLVRRAKGEDKLFHAVRPT